MTLEILSALSATVPSAGSGGRDGEGLSKPGPAARALRERTRLWLISAAVRSGEKLNHLRSRLAALGPLVFWPSTLLLVARAWSEWPMDDSRALVVWGVNSAFPMLLLCICRAYRERPGDRRFEAPELGSYTLEHKIGEGGMGEIYRAWHTTLRRPAAIKLMTGPTSEAALRRFEREVQLTARLTHPNTISVYDYGRTPDGRFYYVMELLDGRTLEQLVMSSGPQHAGRVIHILLQLCGALREAHEVGLIHRDIKPSNIHLCSRGGIFDVVKVLDFGLVQECGNVAGVSLDDLDAIVGTPLYLSPEAILSPARIDARADIYGIGIVGYFLLCGSTPFSGASLPELYGHHLYSVPVAPSQRAPEALALDLERLVLRCLAKDPAARPQSAQDLAEELHGCRDAGTWSEANAKAAAVRWNSALTLPIGV